MPGKMIKSVEKFSDLLHKNLIIEFNKEKNTFEAIAKHYEADCDAVILAAIARERLLFIGGSFTIEITEDEQHFLVGMEAFFQKTDGEWVVKKNKSSKYPIELLILDDRRALKQERRIAYELTHPEKGEQHD